MSKPWEHGSELTLRFPLAVDAPSESPWSTESRYYGSGRDALRHLVRHGVAIRGWKRLLVPFYFCQYVVRALQGEIAVDGYLDLPTFAEAAQRRIQTESGDVVLNSNTFGLRDHSWSLELDGVDIIEDHTHDPWSLWAQESRADYAIASLRKTLPLPDGGVLWSPRGNSLPDQPAITSERQHASERKLASQLLKTLYLAGHPIEKADFRALSTAAEAGIASGDVSGMPPATLSLLKALPVARWRAQRKANFRQVLDTLSNASAEVLRPRPNAVAFSIALLLSSREHREEIRTKLVGQGVYSAVLWDLTNPALKDMPKAAQALSDRCLVIACDYRYNAYHMSRLVDIVTQLI